jgi:cation transport ATPase
MKFSIRHEMKGRIRIHVIQKRMTARQADQLQYYLQTQMHITSVKVRENTQDVSISYLGERSALILVLRKFRYETAEVPDVYLQNSGRELNEQYKEKLIGNVVLRAANKLFLPYPVRVALTLAKSVKYLAEGVRTLAKGRIEVPVLDATAIGVSMIRGDFDTAGSVMFLLRIGEILEEWTHKKSVDDLARSMSLNVDKVWLKNGEQQILVPSSKIQVGDQVVVHMGNVIPF